MGLLKKRQLEKRPLIGWNEWCSLPMLHLPFIKAKIDTGAKTSALHAFNIRSFHHRGNKIARFDIHPIQGNNNLSITCEAPIVDERFVMSSNGHKEHRFVISTPLCLGEETWDIQITLSNRDPLTFRMLLGREALKNHVIIDPSHSQLLGKAQKNAVLKHYTTLHKSF